jgi:hypothetical protein
MDREHDWTPGRVIAVRGDGAFVVYDGDTPDGTACGHIVGPEGTVYPPKDLLNLMKFNAWVAPGPGDPQRSAPTALGPYIVPTWEGTA